MPTYRKHVFVCENMRNDGRKSCAAHASPEMCEYLKLKAGKSTDLARGSVRINRSGCLGRCASGPTLVIYPEGTWYTYTNQADIDEIFERDIVAGERVTRLQLE